MLCVNNHNETAQKVTSPHELLLLVYCVEGESTPVESPVLITCFCVVGRDLLRGDTGRITGVRAEEAEVVMRMELYNP